MSPTAATRYVVALEIAGTAHLVAESDHAAGAIEAAFGRVRREDILDWWPRRQAGDFIAPHASPYLSGGRAFEVGLPIRGTAYVAVAAADPVQAVALAFIHATFEDVDDWRPVRGAENPHPPSVALEADTEK